MTACWRHNLCGTIYAFDTTGRPDRQAEHCEKCDTTDTGWTFTHYERDEYDDDPINLFEY